jgi:hypothetical protein
MIYVLFVLVVVGVLLYVLHAVVPLGARIRTLIDVVVILGVLWWLLNVFGLLHGGPVLDGPHGYRRGC